jgi:hypothetical protein
LGIDALYKSGEGKFMQTDPNDDTNGRWEKEKHFNRSVEKGVWDSGNRKTSS